MKIEVNRKAFEQALSRLSGSTNGKATLAILSHVLIDSDKDGQITISATDLEMSAKTTLKCDAAGNFKVALPCKHLLDIVKSIDGEDIMLTLEDNHWVKLESGKIKARVGGIHPSDFPNLPDESKFSPVKLDAPAFLDMVARTVFCASSDDARPNLTGVFLRQLSSARLQMAATDGHRLARVEHNFGHVPDQPTPVLFDVGVIVHRKAAMELAKFCKGAKHISFGVHENNIAFFVDDGVMICRLVDGSFPDFAQVLPKPSEKTLLVDKDTFFQSVKFVSLFANNKTSHMRVTISEGKMELYATDGEKGECTKDVPIEYDGPTKKAGYNWHYLLDVLNHIEGETIRIDITEPLAPTTIHDDSDDDVIFVVMPMRI